MVIDVDAVTIETADRALSLSYADVIELKAMDYAVALATGNETYTISRLGYDTDAFYQQVLAAYNAKVLESLFVSGTPLIEAKGHYSFSAEGRTSLGSAVIQLYERCLVLLPANLDARRIPCASRPRSRQTIFVSPIHSITVTVIRSQGSVMILSHWRSVVQSSYIV